MKDCVKLILFLLFINLSCGSKTIETETTKIAEPQKGKITTKEEEPTSNSTFYEESFPLEQTTAKEEKEEGVGKLKVVVKAGNTANPPCKIKIIKTDGGKAQIVVKEGTSGEYYTVPEGIYDIEVKLLSTLDQPERREKEIIVRSGEEVTKEVNFSIGSIILIPMKGNQKLKGTLKWRYAGGGDWFPQTTKTEEEVLLSTGRYDAELNIGKMNIVISDIQVYEGKRTVTPEVHFK